MILHSDTKHVSHQAAPGEGRFCELQSPASSEHEGHGVLGSQMHGGVGWRDGAEGFVVGNWLQGGESGGGRFVGDERLPRCTKSGVDFGKPGEWVMVMPLWLLSPWELPSLYASWETGSMGGWGSMIPGHGTQMRRLVWTQCRRWILAIAVLGGNPSGQSIVDHPLSKWPLHI
jgi:hypothetical protein